MDSQRGPEEKEQLRAGAIALAEKLRAADEKAELPDMLQFAHMPDMAAQDLIGRADVVLAHEATNMSEGHGRFMELRAAREALARIVLRTSE